MNRNESRHPMITLVMDCLKAVGPREGKAEGTLSFLFLNFSKVWIVYQKQLFAQ